MAQKTTLGQLKIFFMGTSRFSEGILADLLDKKIPIDLVVTQPDRQIGRKRQLTYSCAKTLALKSNLKIKQYEKITSRALSFFQSEKPDLIIVAAYGIILPRELIQLPKYGCINVHASLLPSLRGPSPIQTSLLQNARITGTTIMLMDEKIDNGDILAQKNVTVEKTDTYPELEDKILNASNDLLAPTLEDWVTQKIIPKKQLSKKATFTKIITKQDGKIVWANSAEEIFDQYRAYFQWPKVFTFWRSSTKLAEKKLILEKISFDANYPMENRKMGQVFRNSKGAIAIQTSRGAILLKTVRLEGKTPVDIKSFVNGYPDFAESILE